MYQFTLWYHEEQGKRKENEIYPGNHNISFNFMWMHKIETHILTVTSGQLWPVSKPRSPFRASRHIKCAPREEISVSIKFISTYLQKGCTLCAARVFFPLFVFAFLHTFVMPKWTFRVRLSELGNISGWVVRPKRTFMFES